MSIEKLTEAVRPGPPTIPRDTPARPLRIAVLTELFPPSMGGQEVFFDELGSTLAAEGHSVDIYCIAHAAGLPRTEARGGLAIHRYPEAPGYKRPLLPGLRRSWWAIIRYSLWIRGLMRDGGHDYYVLNEWPLLHVLTLPRRARARSAIHWCEIRRDPLFRLLQGWLPRLVPQNLAISPGVADEIAARTQRPVAVVPSGIRLASYRSRPRVERSDIVYVGRIAAHKNLPFLVDAYAALRERGFAGRLAIAGDGPAMAELVAHVTASPVSHHIDILGQVDEQAKADLLSRALVVAMPSRREGFPRVVAEAMASGAPVVTADFDENGTRDVVRHYGIGIVTGPTAASFADGIAEAAARWDEFSARGLARAGELDWVSIARAFVGLVAADHAAGPGPR